MKLWVGNPENIPNGYTYIKGYEDAVKFMDRCKRMRDLVGNRYEELWDITEINVPFDEVDKYASLFSFNPQSEQFPLNSHEE